MTYDAEYHVRVDTLTGEFVRILAATMVKAAKKVFELNAACNSVEVRILGGHDWQEIKRDEV